ncbi:MAG: DUF2750 domain-containing protein [Puniceicoccales bacterium]|jgi:hypothetical protein|nr:DUF2750 domain-containing protein [Puniceicoccales bacterium]
MNYKPSEKEIEMVLRSGVDARVRYFIHKVADWEYLWLMCDDQDNLITAYDATNKECIPVWPFKEYADIFFNGFEEKKLVKKMEVHDFLHGYIDKLIENNIYVFIFPDTESRGALARADVFQHMMEDELVKYGDYDDKSCVSKKSMWKLDPIAKNWINSKFVKNS